jgi:hypothetical protein
MKRTLRGPLWSLVTIALTALLLSKVGAAVFGQAALSIAFGVIGGSVGAAAKTADRWRGRTRLNTKASDSDPDTFFLRLANALLPGELRAPTLQIWRSERSAIRVEAGRFAALRFSAGLLSAAICVSVDHWRFSPAHSLAGGVPPTFLSSLSNQKRRSFGYRLTRIAGGLVSLRVASAVLNIGFWTYLGWLGIAVLGTYLYDTLRGRQ